MTVIGFLEDVDRVVLDLSRAHVWDASAVGAIDKAVLRSASAESRSTSSASTARARRSSSASACPTSPARRSPADTEVWGMREGDPG